MDTVPKLPFELLDLIASFLIVTLSPAASLKIRLVNSMFLQCNPAPSLANIDRSFQRFGSSKSLRTPTGWFYHSPEDSKILETRPFYIRYLRFKLFVLPPILSTLTAAITSAITSYGEIRQELVEDTTKSKEREARYTNQLIECIADTITFHEACKYLIPDAEAPRIEGRLRRISSNYRDGDILAAINGDLEIFRSRVSFLTETGETYHPFFGSPIAAAARFGQATTVQYLLLKGASIFELQGLANFWPQVLLKRFPLLIACLEGHQAVIDILLAHGETRSQLCKKQRGGIYQYRKCISLAIRSRNYPLVYQLMEIGNQGEIDGKEEVFVLAAGKERLDLMSDMLEKVEEFKDEGYFSKIKTRALERATVRIKLASMTFLLSLPYISYPDVEGPANKYGDALHIGTYT